MAITPEKAYENEVLRIARAKWPQAAFCGAAMIEGKERDGMFETEECIHFVEATVSASSHKAKEDTKKLFKLVASSLKTLPTKAAKGWFITKNEPTADQRKEVNEHGKGQVTAISLAQFQQTIIDVRAYISARKNHFFGSVSDPSGRNNTSALSYVDIGVFNTNTSSHLNIKELTQSILSGQRFLLLGDYGAGKSMTLREAFNNLSKMHHEGKTTLLPLYINLREHMGQSDAVEIIERHGRKIGFENTSSLVRAWRAGFAILLIDGFDEITTIGAQGVWKI